MIELNTTFMAILGLLGTALLAHLGSVLYGRVGKRLFIAPLAWIASRTRTRKDDKLVEEAKKDLGIAEEGK